MLFRNHKETSASDQGTESEKREQRREEETPVATFGSEPFGSFAMGVLEVFQLKEEKDVVVLGRVYGKALSEDPVYVTNIGDDAEMVSYTNLAGIEVDRKRVPSAENCLAAIRIKEGFSMSIRPGTVIFTRDQGPDPVRRAYLSTLGELYIQKKEMSLSKADQAALSLTDAVELLRLYRLYLDQIRSNLTPEELEVCKDKIDLMTNLITYRLLYSRSVYAVYSRRTREPHLFSATSPTPDGEYYCAPPDVRLISKPYVKIFGPMYDPNLYEIREIQNDEKDTNHIALFLDQMFHLNGAEGVTLIYDNIGISKKDLEPKIEEILHEMSLGRGEEDAKEAPVSNPDLERWILLLGQTDPEGSEKDALSYRLYYRFMARELPKARFLIPIPEDLEGAVLHEDHTVSISDQAALKLPTIPGKNELPATLLFTDWRHLRMDFQEENALIRTLDDLLNFTDCVINFTKASGTGIYLSKESYESLLDLK